MATFESQKPFLRVNFQWGRLNTLYCDITHVINTDMKFLWWFRSEIPKYGSSAKTITCASFHLQRLQLSMTLALSLSLHPLETWVRIPHSTLQAISPICNSLISKSSLDANPLQSRSQNSKLLQKLSLNILTLVSRSQSAVYDPPRPFVNMCYLRPKCKTRLFDCWKLWKLAALANFNRCSIWHHKIEFSKCGRVSTKHCVCWDKNRWGLTVIFQLIARKVSECSIVYNHKCVQKKAGIFGLMRQCQKEPLNWNPCQHDANDTHLVAFNNV